MSLHSKECCYGSNGEQARIYYSPHREQQEETSTFNIYDDPELLEIMKVEKILRGGDGIDLQILKYIDQKQTYESIAEKLFISVSAVKYRLKNLCKIAEVSGIKELMSLVEKYYF